MKTIAEMLKEEVKRSTDYSKVNFGAQGGDDFPEVARSIMNEAAGTLIANFAVDMVKQSLPGSLERLMDMMKKDMPGHLIVTENRAMFHTYLLMTYWGIQIGRRLEREQAEVLRSMETKS